MTYELNLVISIFKKDVSISSYDIDHAQCNWNAISIYIIRISFQLLNSSYSELILYKVLFSKTHFMAGHCEFLVRYSAFADGRKWAADVARHIVLVVRYNGDVVKRKQ